MKNKTIGKATSIFITPFLVTFGLFITVFFFGGRLGNVNFMKKIANHAINLDISKYDKHDIGLDVEAGDKTFGDILATYISKNVNLEKEHILIFINDPEVQEIFVEYLVDSINYLNYSNEKPVFNREKFFELLNDLSYEYNLNLSEVEMTDIYVMFSEKVIEQLKLDTTVKHYEDTDWFKFSNFMAKIFESDLIYLYLTLFIAAVYGIYAFLNRDLYAPLKYMGVSGLIFSIPGLLFILSFIGTARFSSTTEATFLYELGKPFVDLILLYFGGMCLVSSIMLVISKVHKSKIKNIVPVESLPIENNQTIM